jgi:hypothetical protein
MLLFSPFGFDAWKTTSNSFYNKLGLGCMAIVVSQVLNIRPTLDLELRPRILGGE